MKRMIVVAIGAAAIAALTATGVWGATEKAPLVRTLTGKVTTATARTIAVSAKQSSLRCATAGKRVSAFLGKRASMTCRASAGRLVLTKLTLLRASRPATGLSSDQTSGQGASGASDSNDVADDEDEDADDDSATDDEDEDDDDSATDDDEDDEDEGEDEDETEDDEDDD